MREVLFRGKQVTNGTWVYGNLIDDCYIVGGVIDWSEDDRWREVQENKVKQRHSRCNDAELKG